MLVCGVYTTTCDCVSCVCVKVECVSCVCVGVTEKERVCVCWCVWVDVQILLHVFVCV